MSLLAACIPHTKECYVSLEDHSSIMLVRWGNYLSMLEMENQTIHDNTVNEIQHHVTCVVL